MSDTATVRVKSAFASKLNWGAFVALILTALNFFGVVIPQEIASAFQEALTAALVVYVWVVKTFFTNTVTPSSVGQ